MPEKSARFRLRIWNEKGQGSWPIKHLKKQVEKRGAAIKTKPLADKKLVGVYRQKGI